MATNYPTSLDTFTNPSAGSALNSPSHAGQHADINDAMEAVQAKLGVGAGTIGAWTDYTPTLTAMTVSTSAARYCQINKTVVLALYFVVTSVSGSPNITVPSGLNIARWGNFQTVNLLDAGVSNYIGGVFYTNATSFNVYSVGASGSYANLAGINATTPFTWGAGDVIEGIVIYEAA